MKNLLLSLLMAPFILFGHSFSEWKLSSVSLNSNGDLEYIQQNGCTAAVFQSPYYIFLSGKNTFQTITFEVKGVTTNSFDSCTTKPYIIMEFLPENSSNSIFIDSIDLESGNVDVLADMPSDGNYKLRVTIIALGCNKINSFDTAVFTNLVVPTILLPEIRLHVNKHNFFTLEWETELSGRAFIQFYDIDQWFTVASTDETTHHLYLKEDEYYIVRVVIGGVSSNWKILSNKVGVKDNIYPNPTEGEVYVPKNTTLTVIRNISGEEVYRSSDSKINLSMLPNGVYLVYRFNEDGDVYVNKLILTK